MKFLPEADRLTITFEGLEIVWGLRRSLVIPKTNILDLKWEKSFNYTGRRLLRMGGTGLIDVLYAGNFRSRGKRYFLYLDRPKSSHWITSGNFELTNVLAITVKDFRYERVLVSCDEAIGTKIRTWWSGRG